MEELSLWRWYGSLIYEHLADVLTMCRIWIVCYLVPCFFFLGMDPWIDPRFFWLLVVAALTGLFDGIVARRTRKTPSEFGKNFDKVADKICEAFIFSVMITMICWAGQYWLLLFFIPSIRTESFLVGVSFYNHRNGNDDCANQWGKRKMALYFAIGILWLMPTGYWHFLQSATGISSGGYYYIFFALSLFTAAILGLVGFFEYLKKAYQDRK